MDALIHILHLEDDPADAELVQATLAEAGLACRITHVQTRDEYEIALRDSGMDIILVDYRMPSYDGMSALRLAHERRPEIPFVFVSGHIGEEAAIEALTRGATDYVLKQNLARLPSAVKRALSEARNRRERRRTQEALQRSNEILRAIIEAAPVAIIGLDLEGRVHSVWNPAAEKMLGWSTQDVIGRPLPSVPMDGQAEFKGFREKIRSGMTIDGVEVHRQRRDGTPIDYSIYASPLHDAQGLIIGNIAVLVDITERKKLEEQLRQSQKLEAVGQLAGGVAHDFNNMLGVIIGHAELSLAVAARDDPMRPYLEEILSAGLRSTEITRQLLAFARKQAIAPKLLDLNKTIEGMLKLLKRLIGEDIDLAWRPAGELWPVKMDPSQVDQILANLCVNARDALTGAGKLTIETQNAYIDDAYCSEYVGFSPGEYVMLAVSDNGSGMDKAMMNKIFEPFFTTKEVGAGTGMGLATVYGIVKQNEGFIKVYSEPSHGSTFKIYLPRHTAKADQEPKANPAPQSLRGLETILVAEDEPSNLHLVKLMLESYGYQVLTASTPGEALLVARGHAGGIHLLLTDLIMPEMNGRELANEITALCPDIMCVFMSGYTGNVIVQHGVLEEGVHFIQKPFLQQDLAAKVREALDSKQAL